MSEPSNTRGATPKRTVDLHEMFDAYDSLPQPMRHFLQEAVVQWDPFGCATILRDIERDGFSPQQAAREFLNLARRADMSEIYIFGKEYFGDASPHLRAGASIQRYGERSPVYGRRRRGRRA